MKKIPPTLHSYVFSFSPFIMFFSYTFSSFLLLLSSPLPPSHHPAQFPPSLSSSPSLLPFLILHMFRLLLPIFISYFSFLLPLISSSSITNSSDSFTHHSFSFLLSVGTSTPLLSLFSSSLFFFSTRVFSLIQHPEQHNWALRV